MNIFGPSAPNKRGIHVSLNYPNTDVKMVSPKKDLLFLPVCWAKILLEIKIGHDAQYLLNTIFLMAN